MKLNIKTLIVTLLSVLFIFSGMIMAGNEDYGYYEVPKLDLEPELDGIISDGEWVGSADVISTNEDTDIRMITKLFWNDEYLYFASFVNDSKVWGTLTEENDPVWTEDSIELFIDVQNNNDGGRGVGSFQLCFGPGGAYVENAGTEAVDKPDGSWSGDLEFGVVVLGTNNDFSDVDLGWGVEGRIAWENMDISADAGQKMGFNAHAKVNSPDGEKYDLQSSSGIDWVHATEGWHVIELVK